MISAEPLSYLPRVVAGVLINVELFVLSLIFALVVGLALGVATISTRPVFRVIWRAYASIIMGVPSLLVIFIIYYGGSMLLTGITGRSHRIELTPFMSGVAALTMVYSVYVAELIHGAARNVPSGQFEACAALAINAWGGWRCVILPQMLRLALPGLTNIAVVVLKDTSLVSIAGMNDIVTRAKIAAGATQEPFLFFITASVLFILLSSALMPISAWLRVKLNAGLPEYPR